MKLIIQSLPGALWDEFNSHIFSPLFLHTFKYIFRFLLPVVHSNLRQMLVEQEDFEIVLFVLLVQRE